MMVLSNFKRCQSLIIAKIQFTFFNLPKLLIFKLLLPVQYLHYKNAFDPQQRQVANCADAVQ